MFRGDSMSGSGSHCIVQTSKFVSINTIAVTFGKVIQYISPDLSIIFLKYIKFGPKGLAWGAKVFPGVAEDAATDAATVAESNGKHNVTPDRSDLITGI